MLARVGVPSRRAGIMGLVDRVPHNDLGLAIPYLFERLWPVPDSEHLHEP